MIKWFKEYLRRRDRRYAIGVQSCSACMDNGRCRFYSQDQVDEAIKTGNGLDGAGKYTYTNNFALVVCARSVFQGAGFKRQLEGARMLSDLLKRKRDDTNAKD